MNRNAITPGLTPTIDCFGDSLTVGTGGTALSTLIGARLTNRVVRNWGVGGQTATQIASRQGGASITLTSTGNTATQAGVVITSISSQLLSTPADNTARYIGGVIGNNACIIERTATGGPPSTSEVYKLYACTSTGFSVPAGSIFVPDDGWNARDSILTIWSGRNNVPALTAIPGLITDMLALQNDPIRALVIGVLPALEEISGTTRDAIVASWAAVEQVCFDTGAIYIPATPPTIAEMVAIGYNPSGQDTTDIAAGVFPTGMRSDAGAPHIHLTTDGYAIFANRCVKAIREQGW